MVRNNEDRRRTNRWFPEVVMRLSQHKNAGTRKEQALSVAGV
jgi:hypothetical protein